MQSVPDAVQRFREEYRSVEISPRYRGAAHLIFTLTFSLLVVSYCVARIDAPTPLEWLAVPFTFLYANLAEYWGHRTAMHHPVRFLKLVYRRHAGQHHRFFTDTAMAFETSRDFKAVLFPPILVTFFLAVFALPVGWLIAVLFTANTAYFFGATALAYFLNYEILHLAYHLPDDHWIARFPGLPFLRAHHLLHHNQQLMTTRNFNITYPISDWIFGTLQRKA